MKLQLATKEEADAIWAEVNKWTVTTPSWNMWSSARGTARTAVGEYIANQRGLTLYNLEPAPKTRGFTVIELMIVAAIICILAAIAIPNFKRFEEKRRQGYNWQCTSEARDWVVQCAKTTDVSTCQYRAQELFCKY